jgi:hypothetical protein
MESLIIKTKLNLGSGHKPDLSFINVDDDPLTHPDIVLNIDDPKLVLPFEDSSITEVRAWHILEHIGPGYFKLLQELYRVCQHGSIIDIQVPNWSHENFVSDPTHQRPITVEGLRLFSKKYNKLEIERQGSSSCLGLRYDVDFELVAFTYIPDNFYQGIASTLSPRELERLSRESINVIQEIQIKLVVVKQ